MKKQYPTYILITEDNEIIWFGPSSKIAAQTTAAYEAKQRGKAVHYAKLEGTASAIILSTHPGGPAGEKE